jgi:stress response protein SCP2
MGRLYRHNNEWKFDAMGTGSTEELEYFLNQYQ